MRKAPVMIAALLLIVSVASYSQTTTQLTPTQSALAAPTPTLSNPTLNNETDILADFDWNEVGKVLIVFLVLSIVFESAMTPVFNWRVFLRHFDGRGVKTPVTVLLAFIIFWAYDLDIVHELLVALGHASADGRSNLGGRILTGLLIAGGSDGIFRIFTKLGLRNPEERKQKAAAEREKVEEEKKKEGSNSGEPNP